MGSPAQNRRFILKSRPDGALRPEQFAIETAALPDLADGQFLIANHYASIDPAMRGWLDDRPSYLPPVPLGAAMRSGTVGQVIASRAAAIPVGTWLKGINAIEDYSVGTPGDGNRVVDPTRVTSMSHYISVAGGASLTAWVGIHRILLPRPGETMLVSSAAGAVGSVAGQLAKQLGARVIGIAGGEEKCRHVIDELGFDAAIDHRDKDYRTIRAAIRDAAPKGLDMLFENVGGVGLDAALGCLAKYARIALCGLISEYNGPAVGARNLKELIFRSATMRGFTLLDFPDDILPATDALLAHADRGDILFGEQIEFGIENAFEAMVKLFEGGTSGKLILQIG